MMNGSGQCDQAPQCALTFHSAAVPKYLVLASLQGVGRKRPKRNMGPETLLYL